MLLSRVLVLLKVVLFGHCGVRAVFARDSATRPKSSNIRKLVLLDNSIPVMLVTMDMSSIRMII